MIKEFILTPEHIKLLSSAYTSWDDCEFGSPEIDPKRPYGNSDVISDIVEVLDWKVVKDDNDNYDDYIVEKAIKLHKETRFALEIILRQINKKIKYGTYIRNNNYEWKFKNK